MTKQVREIPQGLGFEFILTVGKDPEYLKRILILHWFEAHKHA